MADEKNAVISRYSTGARLNHWVTAASLILLALSGFALFHPSLFFLTALFGGGQMARIIHPFIGVVLVVSFLGLFLRFVWFNFLTMDDIRWLFRLGAVLRNDEERIPEVGRYNAGQKLYFWGMTLSIAVLVVSGVAIWLRQGAISAAMPSGRLAAIVGSSLSAAARMSSAGRDSKRAGCTSSGAA